MLLQAYLASEPLYWIWVFGTAAFLGGLALLYWARVADRRHYIIEKATPLSLSMINARDDVWLRGQAKTDQPLIAPHFGLPCLFYHYKLEERVRRTRITKGRTETYYTWVTRKNYSQGTPFRLYEGNLSIEIDGREANYEGLYSKTDRVGSWRHTLSYLPCPAQVSAVGSVSEDKLRLESFANIPLLITPMTREEFIKSAEFKEKLMRWGGFFLVWAGAVIVCYGLFDFWKPAFPSQSSFRLGVLLRAVFPGTAVLALVWGPYTYNSFVTYQVRVKNAWRQIDVDLKMRYDLIPNLVEAAKAYMKHEKEVLERVTQLRRKAVEGGQSEKMEVESDMVSQIGVLLGTVERYPELKAQPPVAKVIREIRALEQKIAHGRKVYNEVVTEYNNRIQSFPHSILARLIGLKRLKLFEIEESKKESSSSSATELEAI